MNDAWTSVVIVTWNSAEVIADCVDSVVGTPHMVEVIVVDNDSTDGTPDLVRRLFPDVRVIESGGNLGFAPAVNIGLAASTAPRILMLNPDARLLPGALDSLCAELVDETVGLCGPKIVRPDGSLEPYGARRMPSPLRAFSRLLGINRLAPRQILSESLADGLGDSTADVPCITGAAVLCRRDLLESSGGLDTTIPMYFEDLELCERCYRQGLRARYVGSATAEHVGGFSSGRSAHRAVLWAMEDGLAPWLYLRRFGSTGSSTRYRAAMLLGEIARTVILTAVRAFGPDRHRVRIEQALVRSSALVRWALTSDPRFRARVDAIFVTHEAEMAT